MLSKGKLGFWALTALVFGLMVGVGIYNLPQNMAAAASPGGVALAWMITALGILPLVIAFNWLSDRYPQYNAGIYQYAQAEFGNYAGFNIAWGYWLCTAFSNVTYAVMLNDSVGAFIPALNRHGWETVLFGSSLIWLMYYIVSRGLQTANFINSFLAVLKVLMLVFIVTVFAIGFKLDLFESDFWGGQLPGDDLGSQVKSCMMVTLFCFFGVEGAVMMSARARKPSDVGRAGAAGFTISLVLYLAVSLLCFGLLSKAKLAGLPDPSIAYILRESCGEWAYWFVISAVIVSLLGGWVAWTLVVAQVPYEAALVGILPSHFRRLNHHDMPSFGLFASSVVMNLFLIMVVMADNVYLTSLHITGLMIIPCYLFTGLFLLKKADSPGMRIVAVVTVLFCCWMAYAGGLKELMMTSVFYCIGVGFFIQARREYNIRHNLVHGQIFKVGEKWTFAILLLLSLITLAILARG